MAQAASPDCTPAQYKTLSSTKTFCAVGTTACVTTGTVGGCYNAGDTPQCGAGVSACVVKEQVVDGKFTAGGGTSTGGGSTPPTPVGNGDRTITLVNSCSYDVWWGYTGGAVGTTGPRQTGTPVSCSKDSDCPGASGQQICDTDTSQCYWNIGSGATVTPTKIAASGQTSVSINNTAQPINGTYIKWSGNIWAAKGCKKPAGSERMVCDSINCGTDGCAAYRAPNGVRAQAEFTFQSNAKDYYDVSAIAGFNIPVSMGPTSGQTFATAPTNPGGSKPAVLPSEYWCTTGGATTAQGKLSACTWTADISKVTSAPSSAGAAQIALVTPGNLWDTGFTTTSCTKDSDCTDASVGTTCGQWQSVNTTGFGPLNPVDQVCGNLSGMITPNGYCTYTGTGTTAANNSGAPWSCSATTGQGTGTNTTLYECNGENANSGYQIADQGQTSVCGCENWNFSGTDLPVGQLGCQANNTVWQSTAKWGAEVVKRACPTAYSYPYDDETSTFTCQTPPGNPGTNEVNANATNYTITFCPGGVEGSVTGAN